MMHGIHYLPYPQQVEACEYLPELQARFEQAEVWGYDDAAFCHLIELAYRRFGPLFFRYACPGASGCAWCGRCVPLRVPVAEFRASRSQQRVRRRGEAIRCAMGPVRATRAKHRLYLRFQTRFAERVGHPDSMDYERFASLPWFTPVPFATECRYYLGDELVGVGMIDVASRVLSSSYFYHDPEYARYSLGTLSMLREIELAAAQGIPYYYHGYTVAENRHMRYKLDLRPLEYFDGAAWRPLRTAAGDWLHDPEGLRTLPSVPLLVP